MIVARNLWITSYAAQALRAGATIAASGGLRAKGKERAMDIGDPIRVIEVSPSEIPVPQEIPESDPEFEPEEEPNELDPDEVPV